MVVPITKVSGGDRHCATIPYEAGECPMSATAALPLPAPVLGRDATRAAPDHRAVYPPSITSSLPVTNRDSSEAR